MVDELLTNSPAAARLGVPYWKLRSLIKSGRIPESVRAGRNFLVPASAVPAIKARLVAEKVIKADGGAHA